MVSYWILSSGSDRNKQTTSAVVIDWLLGPQTGADLLYCIYFLTTVFLLYED